MKKKERKPKRDGRSRLSAWLHSVQARCLLVTAVGCVIILALFFMACAPQRYDIKVGSISHSTINATKDVVDEITTGERRRVAASAVEPTYHLDETAADEVNLQLRQVFDELRNVQLYGLTLRTPEDTPISIRTKTFTDTEIANAQALVTSISLSRYQLITLLRTQTTDYDTMVNTITIAVDNAMNTTIREGQVNQSLDTIKQIAGYSVQLSLMQNIVPTVLRHCVKPNMVIDQERTQQARLAAADAVEPVTYLQGQCIVRDGDLVGKAQWEMLNTLGLLSGTAVDYAAYIGGLLQVIISMMCMVLLQLLLDRSCFSDIRRINVIMLIMVLDTGLCVLLYRFANLYVAPVVMGAMLLTGLLGWRCAIPAGVGLSMLAAGLASASTANNSAEVIALLMMNLTGVLVSASFLVKASQRMRVVLCGLLVAVTNAACALAIGMMTSFNLDQIMSTMVWYVAGAVLSGMLALGLQPVFESAFNLSTFSRLQELSNPEQPLLRKLLIEAPGTYHHSIIVANLAEAAAERIGANPALARTASYYHDVGKLKRPMYFKENQIGENLHDTTDPYVSAAIVTSHTRDGVLLAQKYRLTPQIQNIILEHHGDTPVMFFYHKACQAAPDKQINIDDFRYDGRRPSTREAAIVMLADTVEAAVRSMANPTPEAIREFIEKLVRGKLEDGQLSDAPLTLKDIKLIIDAFCTVLNGVFHERIEYPNVEVPHRSVTQEDAPAEDAKLENIITTNAPHQDKAEDTSKEASV